MESKIQEELLNIERKKQLLEKCKKFVRDELNSDKNDCFTSTEINAISKYTEKLETEINIEYNRIISKNKLYNESIKNVEQLILSRQNIIDKYFTLEEGDVMKIFAPYQTTLQHKYDQAMNMIF